jgi:hypothetical protein
MPCTVRVWFMVKTPEWKSLILHLDTVSRSSPDRRKIHLVA